MKIGFKNFRQFKNFEPIETRGITFLVGQNNAGKSTFIKALLLLDNYFKGNVDDFQFSTNTLNDSNIETFDRALNKKSKSKSIIFNLEQELTYDTTNHFTDEKGITRKLLIKDFKFLAQVSLSNNSSLDGKNIEELIFDLPKANFKLVFDFVNGEIEILKGKTKLDGLLKLETFELENYINKLKRELLTDNESERVSTQKELTFAEDVLTNRINKYSDKNYQSTAFRTKISFTNFRNSSIDFNSLSQYLTEAIENLKKSKDTSGAKKEFDEIYLEWVSDTSDCPPLYPDISKTDLEYFEFCFKSIDLFLNSMSEKSYLGLHLLNPMILFDIKNKKDHIAQTIHQFNRQQIKEDNDIYPFVLRWLKEFKICDDFDFNFIENQSYSINVIRDNNKIPLTDLGIGAIHIFSLILRVACKVQSNGRIATQYRNFNHKLTQEVDYTGDDLLFPSYRNEQARKLTMIVEEPETNLHPALQSKLADFFYEVNKEYNIQFIVETHSEYIIRRSQVIVAQSKLGNKGNNNPFSIHYFTADENNPAFEIKLNNDGSLEKNFGSGFFDEASTHVLEMIKLKRISKN